MYKIEVNNIYKIFGKNPQSALTNVKAGMGKDELLDKKNHVLGIKDVSLKIEEGEIFVIMGLSGSGKSTMIRHFNRLIDPTAGEVLVDGHNIVNLKPSELRALRREKISMVFQRFGLLPHKTIVENVAIGLIIGGMNKEEAFKKSKIQIEAVGLAGYESYYPNQLSGGMQQRVGLARALATEADIMLMDEAFSALDPLIRYDMQGQLLELQQKLHKTIVFITHDLDEALRIGNHIAILKDGELKQVGTPEEILLQPADDHIARFVQNVNRSAVVKIHSVVKSEPVLKTKDLLKNKLLAALEKSANDTVMISDGKKIIGGVNYDLVQSKNKIGVKDLHKIEMCNTEDTVEDILTKSSRNIMPLAVLDKNGKYVGYASKMNILQAMAKSTGTGKNKKK